MNSNTQDNDLPRNWQLRLPEPAKYYGPRVEGLGKPVVQGWATGNCPFCGDNHKCFCVRLKGRPSGWHCLACDERGDMVEFHQRLTGLSRSKAVLALMELRQ